MFLHKAVRPQNCVIEPRCLELVFHSAVPAWEGFRTISGSKRGVQNHMAHASFPAGIQHIAFEFHKLAHGGAHQIDRVHAFERAAQARLVGEVCYHAPNPRGHFGRILRRTIHCFNGSVGFENFLQNGATRVAGSASNEYHRDLLENLIKSLSISHLRRAT